jgi:hypothetical protein
MYDFQDAFEEEETPIFNPPPSNTTKYLAQEI